MNTQNNFTMKWLFAALIVFHPFDSYSKDTSARDVVVRIYHDYAWVAVVGDQWHSAGLLSETELSLRQYFSPDLAKMLAADNKCKDKGGVCSIDFDPIYASQDPAVYEMKISNLSNDGGVEVSFKYPSTGEMVRIHYKMVNVGGNWKIGDICYIDKSCLTGLLALPKSKAD